MPDQLTDEQLISACATEVMGWHKAKSGVWRTHDRRLGYHGEWNPLEDILHTDHVIDKMIGDKFGFQFSTPISGLRHLNIGAWQCVFWNMNKSSQEYADTKHRAIVKAALVAKGVRI